MYYYDARDVHIVEKRGIIWIFQTPYKKYWFLKKPSNYRLEQILIDEKNSQDV